jgi:O-antigen/teichoic acid export membrane protein
MSATLTQAAVNPHHRARNTAWNLLGMCAPMVVALFAIPLLVEGMGKERFGLLTMIWMLVGYLGLFDLGLGRALTQTVAQRLGEGRLLEVAGIFWTALGIMSLLGALGGLLAWNLAPWLAYSLLKVDPVLQSETLRSFRVVAFGLPILVSVTGLVGTLEAFQKFKLVNAIRIPTGIYTFVGPLLVLPYSSRLSSVVLALLFGRLVEWLIFFFACLNTIPGVLSPVAHGQRQMAGLFRFGSWMTVTNLISPLLMHVDRFLIGAVRAASEVAYFATPRKSWSSCSSCPGPGWACCSPLSRGASDCAAKKPPTSSCAPAAICCSACFPWLLWWWRWLPNFSPCGWMPISAPSARRS